MALKPVNCLDFNVFKLERLGSASEEPLTADILNDSVILDTADGASELQCQNCPAMCTITQIGGQAIALMHNPDACIAVVDEVS